jgi:hypothetical protein
MAIIDDIEKFEAGASRIRAAAPSLAQRQDPVARPAQRPMVAARPTPALGTRIGAGVRTAASTAGAVARTGLGIQAQNAGRALAASTALPRSAAGIVRDATRAVAGAAPSPDAGQPVALPRFPSLAARPAAATAAAATPAGMPANWSPGARARPRPTAALPPTAAPVAPAAASIAFDLQPGDVNTFTGSDGTTRPVPGLLNAPAGAAAAVPGAPPIAARPVALPQARGRQGAIIENPNDSTVDKLTRNLGSYSFKGSPSARAAVAQAILGEANARQEERAGALATGDRADLAAVDNAARIANENADRDLAAQQTNAELVERRADRSAQQEEQRLARRPDVTVSADGAMGIVSGEGRFTPVTDASGRTVRAPQARPTATTQASPDAALKALVDQRAAVAGLAPPEEGTDERTAYDARLAAIDGQIAQLLPGGASAGAAPEVGTVSGGYRFLGGDPSNQANWEQVR